MQLVTRIELEDSDKKTMFGDFEDALSELKIAPAKAEKMLENHYALFDAFLNTAFDMGLTAGRKEK